MISRDGHALPVGWTLVPLCDLAADEPRAITDGPFGSNLKTTHYTDSGPQVIRLQNVGDGVYIDSKAHISQEHYEHLRKHEAKAGDLVIALLGEELPRACRVPRRIGPAIVKADCVRFRPDLKAISSFYLNYALNSFQVRHRAAAMVHGVGRPRLNLGSLKELEIPLAPMPEQHRIVEAIESRVTRLDAAFAALKRLKVSLGRYRASVLKAAIEGRLVPTEANVARKDKRDYESASTLMEGILDERRRRWEEAELAKLTASGKPPTNDRWKLRCEEPIAPDTSNLPDLPEGWCWARLAAISDVVLGQQRSPAHAAAEITVPYVRAANITWAGLDLSDVKRMGFVNPDRHRLESGDILLSEASGSPMEAGKPAIWRDEIPGACFQNTVLRVRPTNKASILPEFLRLTFLRDCVTGQFAKLAPGVGIVHIGAERLAQWSVPLAPLSEQRRIVAEFARIESLLESVAKSVDAAERRCGGLRNAILKWAFEGKLVDQDPTDEPASVLLERTKAEREGTKTAGERHAPGGRKRKTT